MATLKLDDWLEINEGEKTCLFKCTCGQIFIKHIGKLNLEKEIESVLLGEAIAMLFPTVCGKCNQPNYAEINKNDIHELFFNGTFKKDVGERVKVKLIE